MGRACILSTHIPNQLGCCLETYDLNVGLNFSDFGKNISLIWSQDVVMLWFLIQNNDNLTNE